MSQQLSHYRLFFLIIFALIVEGWGITMAKEEETKFICAHEADKAPVISEEAEALFTEGRRLAIARGEKNWPAILGLYKRASDLGNWKASFNYATLLPERGKGDRIKNLELSLNLIESLMEKKIPIGYYAIGIRLIEGGGGIRIDKEAGYQYMHQAANLGNPQAQYYLGRQVQRVRQHALARQYFQCAVEQGHGVAGYELANNHEFQAKNYPKAAKAYLQAASAGHGPSFTALKNIFTHDTFEYGYGRNEELVACLDQHRNQLRRDPLLTFPHLAEECPLPMHPVMGDGSQYPEMNYRLPDFLERLKTTGHDPEWEQEAADDRMNFIREQGEKRQRLKQQREAEANRFRPKVTDLDEWITSHVQTGEFFVKYQSCYLHLIDGGLEKEITSPYLVNVLNTFNLDYIPVAVFHEKTDGQFRSWV